MKDTITILVCNAVRKAAHERNQKGRELTDQEVLNIAVKVQHDYHVVEARRFVNTYGANVVNLPAAAGSVRPPADLDKAARDSLGDSYESFIREYGNGFTPKQLAEYCDRRRAANGVSV